MLSTLLSFHSFSCFHSDSSNYWKKQRYYEEIIMQKFYHMLSIKNVRGKLYHAFKKLFFNLTRLLLSSVFLNHCTVSCRFLLKKSFWSSTPFDLWVFWVHHLKLFMHSGKLFIVKCPNENYVSDGLFTKFPVA